MSAEPVAPEPPISKSDLFDVLRPFLGSMKPPAGVKADGLFEGYWLALAGCRRSAIEAAIRRFMAGESELKKAFCPTPPEFGALVRGAVLSTSTEPKRRLFRYKRPQSPMLERNLTKAWAMRLIDGGQAPHGSIWCPGPLNDHPEYGDLYGPDPDWQLPVPLDEANRDTQPSTFTGDDMVARDRVQRLLAKTGHRIWRDGRLAEAKAPEPAEPPQPRTVPDYSQDKIEIGAALKKQLGIADEPNPKQPDDFGGIS